jgi:ADP-heptose:LPS heptosyltransferase
MPYSLHWLRLWALTVGRLWDLIVDLRNAPVTTLLWRKRRRAIGRDNGKQHRVVRLARVFDLSEPPAPRLAADAAARQSAMKLIPAGGAVLAVGPTANWRAKTWRAENFADLIARLTAPDGVLPRARIAIFGRDDERPSAISLLETIPRERCLDMVGGLDLLTVYACLERCAFYVGNDSGLMHLAAASGIPTLGLFGPSKDALYAPWGPRTAVVRTPEDFEHIFPPNFDHRTSASLMDSLTVDMAERGARELWARRGDVQ